jgi:hypothetical protein
MELQIENKILDVCFSKHMSIYSPLAQMGHELTALKVLLLRHWTSRLFLL